MVEARNGGGEASSFRAVNQPNSEAARPEESAQSHAVKSTNRSANTTPSKGSSKASSRRNSTHAIDSRLGSGPGNTPSAANSSLQAQQLMGTAAASSTTSSKDSKEPVAAPYGTRSRNRTGTARINYAEDAEMDFEMTSTSTSGAATSAASRNPVAADGAQPSAVSGKRGANAGQGSAAAWGTTGANTKDGPPNSIIPGTSTFAANPQTNSGHAPKRRKNAAKDATNGAQASNGNHAGAGAPSHSGRRTNASHSQSAMIPANGSRESNMMFFRKTGAFLVNGRLESDDGRTVSVNGELPSSFPFTIT